MHYSTSHVHRAVAEVMSVLWGDGEATHLRQPTLCSTLKPTVASVSSTLY